MSYTSQDLTKSAFSIFDMMLQMQRIGINAMTAYQTAAFGSPAPRSGGYSSTRGRTSEVHGKNDEKVIPIGEEVLNVGTRMVPGKTTKVRRVVVETPVEQDVTLHTETVVLERRRPLSMSGEGVLTEVTVEMSDFNEVPVVSKSVHLVEEVLLRKEVTARTETIRDTVKRDKLEIDQPAQLPVVVHPVKQQEDKKAADSQDKKQAVVPMQPESKTAEQKRS